MTPTVVQLSKGGKRLPKINMEIILFRIITAITIDHNGNRAREGPGPFIMSDLCRNVTQQLQTPHAERINARVAWLPAGPAVRVGLNVPTSRDSRVV